MCRVCVEYELGKLTRTEARRNLGEMKNDPHVADALFKIAADQVLEDHADTFEALRLREEHDRLVQNAEDAFLEAAKERQGWEGPDGSGEGSGL